jgi:DnaK suppressor protein
MTFERQNWLFTRPSILEVDHSTLFQWIPTTMNPEQIIQIEQQLNREIEETRNNIDSLSELAKPIAPDNAIGRLSRMEAIGTKSINEASLSRAKIKLEQLKSVLSDLDDPDFGICIECDEQIPMGRIMLMPESRLCVRCASQLEKG